MNFLGKNSKCNCRKIRNDFSSSRIKGYLTGSLFLFAIMLAIPSAKAQFFSSGEQSIRDIYQTSLGRAPDQNGLNYYLYEMENGRSYDSIKTEIENSREAKQYLMTSGPRILSFNAQRIDKNNNTWSFLWSTIKTDSVAVRFQCVTGVKIFATGNTVSAFNNMSDTFGCDEDYKTSPNSGASFRFRNATNKGLIISVRLYPIVGNKIYFNAAKTISFYVGKSLVPTAPLTPDTVPLNKTSESAPKISVMSSKPVVIGSTAKTQTPKVVAIDSFTVADRATLGKNSKRISWKATNAEGVSISLACPPRVTATIVTKGNTKRAFACGDLGQKFNASDYADFIFTNSSKAVATVTVKLSPIINGSPVSSKAVTKSFNLAK